MNLIKMISLAAVATVALASQASAASFAPVSSTFKGVGATTMTKSGIGPFPCTANFTGHTTATGAAFIDSAAFTGSVFCTSITAAALPWSTTVTSATTATINGVTFNSPIGACGPAALPVTLVGGAITFSATINPGNCAVSTTTPIATATTSAPTGVPVSIVFP